MATPTLAVVWTIWSPTHGNLPPQRMHDALGNELGLLGVGVREDHRELVPADSCECIRLANGMPQRTSDGLEQIIACLMAEPVVDLLEVVQIDQEHGAGGSVPRQSGEPPWPVPARSAAD